MEETWKMIMDELKDLKEKQEEHRKETAFQSNQLQLDLSNLRSEMNSNFRYVENVIQEHRGAIEIIGKRTQDEKNRD